MREKPLILVVDDEPSFLEIMSTKLKAAGFDAVTAHSAEQAAHLAETSQPDLILMDIMMPGETGTDGVLAIKQNPATKNIKIVFLSTMKDPWPQTVTPRNELAKQIGVEDFIDKTDDLDAIVEKVKKVL